MATEKVHNLGLINIGPLKAKVITVSKANVALDVTNPLVKGGPRAGAYGSLARCAQGPPVHKKSAVCSIHTIRVVLLLLYPDTQVGLVF